MMNSLSSKLFWKLSRATNPQTLERSVSISWSKLVNSNIVKFQKTKEQRVLQTTSTQMWLAEKSPRLLRRRSNHTIRSQESHMTRAVVIARRGHMREVLRTTFWLEKRMNGELRSLRHSKLLNKLLNFKWKRWSSLEMTLSKSNSFSMLLLLTTSRRNSRSSEIFYSQASWPEQSASTKKLNTITSSTCYKRMLSTPRSLI